MKNLTCIICPNSCLLSIEEQSGEIIVQGNKCKRGIAFGVKESTNPTRSLSTTLKTTFYNCPRLTVKTSGEVSKNRMMELMVYLDDVVVDKKVSVGDIIVENPLNLGVNIVSTSTIE